MKSLLRECEANILIDWLVLIEVNNATIPFLQINKKIKKTNKLK
jgi:hypothetical protein